MTWKRAVTAAVLIPFAVGIVLWGSTALLALAVALVTLLALFEYFALGEAIGHRAYRFWTATCALLLIYAQWRMTYSTSFELYRGLTPYANTWWFAPGFPSTEGVLFVYLMGIAVLTLATKRPLVESLPAVGISSSGLLLVAFPLSYAIRIHGVPGYGLYLLLFALVVIWVSDSVAYFVGRSIGKRPFAPLLSPKKTWEGAIGGFLGSFVVVFAFDRWLNQPLLKLLGLAVVANIAGQIGDLLESAYKRSAGIKDSGSILPGHGGVLDRIDALILAIPVVWYYWILVCAPRS
jgi:phosphatidate cytidylyltransferase